MSSVSINNLVLMGRLTADPELRRSKNNNAVTSFRLAVTRRNNAEVTDFIPCVAFGGLGEFVQQWFQKGTLAIVIGQLTARVWQDKDGNTRTSYEVQCDNIQFGETKKQRVARGAGRTGSRQPAGTQRVAAYQRSTRADRAGLSERFADRGAGQRDRHSAGKRGL